MGSLRFREFDRFQPRLLQPFWFRQSQRVKSSDSADADEGKRHPCGDFEDSQSVVGNARQQVEHSLRSGLGTKVEHDPIDSQGRYPRENDKGAD